MNTDSKRVQIHQTLEEIVGTDAAADPVERIVLYLASALGRVQSELERERARSAALERALRDIRSRAESAFSEEIVPAERALHDTQAPNDPQGDGSQERHASRGREEWQRWKNSQTFERDAALLRLLAETGIPSRTDARRLLQAQTKPHPPSRASVQRAFRRLEEMQLIELIEVPSCTSGSPIHHLVRLTERGIRACRTILKLEPAPSLLTELLARHQSLVRVVLIIETAGALRKAGYTVEMLPHRITAPGASGTCAFTPDLTIYLHGLPLIVLVEQEIAGDVELRRRRWQDCLDTAGDEFYVVTPGSRVMNDVRRRMRCWAQQNGLTPRVSMSNVDQIRREGLQGDEVWIAEWNEPR